MFVSKSLWLLALLVSVALASAARTGGDDPLDELEDRLGVRGDDFFVSKSRRAAVRQLAKLGREGRREAWKLVIGALSDPVPMVADEAEWQLADLADPKLIEGLLGGDGLRSRDDGVPARAAQALGRVALPVNGLQLLRNVPSRDDEARALALASVERLALGGRLAGERDELRDELEKLARSGRKPGIRARALAALSALAPGEAAELVDEALADDEPEVRCAALVVLRRVGAPSGILAAAGDPDVRVRTQAVACLAELGTLAAVRGLVERLELETELRLRWRVVDHLQRLSGLSHRLDARPWRRWVDLLDESFDTEARALAGDGEADEPKTEGVSFARLPLLSERVVFLVDFSGSIRSRIDGDLTRKEYLDRELSTVLGALGPETRFNLVPYANEPAPWRKELSPATPRRVKEALAFFHDHDDTGSGDFWEAALWVLADPEVDNVVVFTDGAPTGGERWHLALMVDLLLERNRFRHVAFDSILVDAPGDLQNEWRRLAEGTQGRSIQLSLEEALRNG